MNMDMANPTTTAMNMATTAGSSVNVATTSAAAAMDMGGGSCKISMLWNWYTVDSCFIARSWHITSKGMFAGACIGVVFLVVAIEALRRAQREYDHYLVRSFLTSQSSSIALPSDSSSTKGITTINTTFLDTGAVRKLRPTVLQQAIRSGIYMLQFTGAYFIMLLAMYYNGYVIISIIVGAYVGHFIFGWDTITGTGQGEGGGTCC